MATPRHACALLAACTVLALGRSAVAADATDPALRKVRLNYARANDADSCAAELELRNAVAARLGYDPFDAAAAETVSARISRRDKAFVADIQIQNAAGKVTGRRAISSQADDCAELSSAMALAISIAIDPLSIARPSVPLPAPPPAPLAPPASCPRPVEPAAPPPCLAPAAIATAPEPPEPPEPPAERVTVRASLGILGSLGAAPAPAFGLNAQVGVRWRWLSVGLEGRVDLPRSALEDRGEIESSVMLLSLLPCGHVSVVAGCLLAGVGGIRGENVPLEIRQTKPYGVAGVRAMTELPIYGPLWARVHVDVLATVSRTVLLVDGEEAWRTPPLQGVLGAALLGTFP